MKFDTFSNEKATGCCWVYIWNSIHMVSLLAWKHV